jgi:hypothetical protein
MAELAQQQRKQKNDVKKSKPGKKRPTDWPLSASREGESAKNSGKRKAESGQNALLWQFLKLVKKRC